MIDYLNRRYGRLTVLRLVYPGVVYAKCDCGTEKEFILNNLRSGNTQSCGCLRREQAVITAELCNTIHGEYRSPEYQAWRNMLGRCENDPSKECYKNYYGRGIRISDKWINNFEEFLKDIGRRPNPELTLDRIDNDGDYEPGNVRWVDRKTQSQNSRRKL